MAAVWPDTSVEESNLTVNVSTLRRLLADDQARVCIEAVPRVGYRFVVPVALERETGGATATSRSNHPMSVRAQELYARTNQIADEPIAGTRCVICIRRALRSPNSRLPGRGWRAVIG
jgi:DNA-binding winged helix-turn-helix (wHTH) protein